MSNVDYVVYCYSCHCCECQGKDVYVGKSKYGVDKRHAGHLKRVKAIVEGRSNKKDLKIDYLIARHGVDNCKIRMLQRCSSEEEMNQREVDLIVEHKTNIKFGGMNFDIGGKGGRPKGVYVTSAETKEKISVATRAYYDNRVYTEEERKLLSERSKKIYQNDPNLASRRAKNSWLKMKSKAEVDEEYRENLQKLMTTKAKLGGEAFLERLSSDPNFREEYSEKISNAVSSWCKDNPDKVANRAQKIAQARVENGTWISSVREANSKVTQEERISHAKKGWETRKKNALNKLSNTDDINLNEAKTTDS